MAEPPRSASGFANAPCRSWPARRDVSRCYLSGGDIARGFLEQAGAKGVDLVCELLPLAVCGRLVGGRFDGLLLLTKGGMIGGPDAIFQMLEKSSAL